MQVVRLFTVRDIQVVAAGIPELSGLVCRFPGSEIRELTEAVRSEKRQREVLACRLLVRELFGTRYRLRHRSSGMPFLDGFGEAVPFVSVSHCRETLVIAFSGSCRVGVDVEAVSEKIVRVGSRILSGQELAFAGDSLLMNTLAWTAKEALFKVAGREGVDFRSDIAVDLAGVRADAVRNEYAAAVGMLPYRAVSVRFGEKFVTLAFEE